MNAGDKVAFISISGGRAYYGPTVLTPIAQPGKLDEYTENAIRRTLFSNEVIGEIKPSEWNTPIDWKTTYTIEKGLRTIQVDCFPENDAIEDPNDRIPWEPGTGYKVLQGSGKIRALRRDPQQNDISNCRKKKFEVAMLQLACFRHQLLYLD